MPTKNEEDGPMTVEGARAGFRAFLEGMITVFKRNPTFDPACLPPTYQALLDRGEVFVGFKPADDDPNAAKYRDSHRPAKRECWKNAQAFKLWCDRYRHEGYRYLEGYVFRVIPIEHGFVVGPDGLVIDHTIEASNRSLASMNIDPGPPPAYVGVEIPAEFIKRGWRSGYARQNLWRFLTGKDGY